MSDSNIKILKVSVSHEEALQTRAVIDKLILKCRPDWAAEDITSRKLSGGFLNLMLCYHLTSDPEPTDGIVVRVCHADSGEKRISRREEFLGMQLGHHAGVFPPILACFNNGVVYKYARGRVLSSTDTFDSKIMRSICRSACRLHGLDVDSVPLIDMDGQPTTYPKENTTEEILRRMIEHAPCGQDDPVYHRFEVAGLSPEDLLREVDEMNSLFEELGVPRCFSHNDLWPANVVYEDSTDHATIVDYEFAALGYRCDDFDGFYGNFHIREFFGLLDGSEPFINDEVKLRWQRIYLEERCKLLDQPPATTLTEDAPHMFDLECQISLVFMKLFWCLGNLLLIDLVDADLDISRMFENFWAYYEEGKKELPRLKKEYLEYRDGLH